MLWQVGASVLSSYWLYVISCILTGFMWSRVNKLNHTCPVILASVIQKLDCAIHRINLYPVDNVIGFPNTYPLHSDLSGG